MPHPRCGDCAHLGTPFSNGDGYYAECAAHDGAAVCSTWAVALAMPDRTPCHRFIPSVRYRLQMLHDHATSDAEELTELGLPGFNDAGVFWRIATVIRRELERLDR